MRLVLLTVLVMTLFAANSLLNRLALMDGAIGAGEFAAIRLVAGAITLLVIVLIRDRSAAPAWHMANPVAVAGLTLYMLGFSYAYLTLDAGLGALILFGGVQVVMFAGGALLGQGLAARRIAGGAVAFAGLAWLVSPAGVAPPLAGAGLMTAAALGWGIYSLMGARSRDSLAATAGNFALAVPPALFAVLLLPGEVPLTGAGVALAVLSGAVTSGLGYALWYAVLPHLAAATAGVAQLTVPVIAMAGGVLLLGEVLEARAVVAAFVVLGGVGVSVTGGRRPSGRPRADQ